MCSAFRPCWMIPHRHNVYPLCWLVKIVLHDYYFANNKTRVRRDLTAYLIYLSYQILFWVLCFCFLSFFFFFFSLALNFLALCAAFGLAVGKGTLRAYEKGWVEDASGYAWKWGWFYVYLLVFVMVNLNILDASLHISIYAKSSDWTRQIPSYGYGWKNLREVSTINSNSSYELN